MLDSFFISFAPCKNVTNSVSNAVLPGSTADHLLNCKDIGLEMCKDFVINRIHGPISLGPPMKEQNLKIFKV